MSGSQHNSMAAPVCIIGGGPAGLMAAEVLAQAGHSVQLFDAMPRSGVSFYWRELAVLISPIVKIKRLLCSATVRKQIGLSVG